MVVTYGGGGFRSQAPGTGPSPAQVLRGGTPRRSGGGGGGRSEAPGAREEIERQQAEKLAQEKAAAEQKAKQEAQLKAQEQQRQQQELQKNRERLLIQQQRKEKVKELLTPKVNVKQIGSRLKETFSPVYNIATGRSLDVKRVSKEQKKLNKEVEDFNKRYGARELSEKEFKQAETESQRLSSKQEKILREKESIESSTSFKVADVVSGRKLQREAEAQGGKLLGGSLPIVPAASIPSAATNIRFIGTEKALEKGRTLTTIGYETSAGVRGVGQAITVPTKSETSISIVGGQSAKKVVSLPSGKVKLTKIRGSIGLEKGKSLAATENKLQGQLSVGRVVGSKRKLTDFISVGKIKKIDSTTYSFGKTITREGAKARFGGAIIKQPSSEIGFSAVGSGPQVTSKATEKLISSIAAAESKQTGALTFKTTSSIVSKPSLQNTPKVDSKLELPKLQIKQKSIQVPSVREATRTSFIPRTSTSSRSSVKQVQKQIQVQKPTQQQKIGQRQVTRQLQIPRQLIQQKQVNRVQQVTVTTPTGFKRSFAPFRLPKVSSRKIQKPKQFGVQVRRGGVFRSVGTFSSLDKAFSVGRSKVSKTLGASFRLTGGTGKVGVPKGFTRSKREKDVFVELPKFRLSKQTEIFEIQEAKKKKKSTKKKK